MNIVAYSSQLFDRVIGPSTELPPATTLRHRSFVDHYYGSNPCCKLYIALDDKEVLIGTHGLELMPFEENGRRRLLGFGSAWLAFRKGVGAYLLMNWLRQCDSSLIFGATSQAVAVYQRVGWRFYEGIRSYYLNKVYDDDGGVLKRVAKKALTRIGARHRLAQLAKALPEELRRISVVEADEFEKDLLAFDSGFRFRFTPDLDHLAWRYSLHAPHIRFRLFKLLARNKYVGYTILQENGHRITVAQADGTDARWLASGIIHAVAAIAETKDCREVVLASSHPVMQELFELVGFRHRPECDRPIAMGTRWGGFQVQVPVAEWLVNYGWGDNAQRPPWRDDAA